MSVKTVICCDGPGCARFVTVTGNRRHARRETRERGWSFTMGRDLCQTCGREIAEFWRGELARVKASRAPDEGDE